MTIQELINQQRSSLEYFWNRLDVTVAHHFIELCAQCTGLLVITGVGKSGFIAEKIAATLISTGTKALYLPPTNFLHGDLGILGKEDLLLLISKSGESEELLDIVPFAKNRGTNLLAIVSNNGSGLERAADCTIHLPLDRELCPFDLAPTTSTVLQLLFGELLSVSLMHKKKFTMSQYALNHPSGAIGKKATLTVGDLMLKGEQLPLVSAEQTLRDALIELTNKRCGCLLVVDKDRTLLGIFTDGDLRRALQHKGSNILEESIAHLMTQTPLHAGAEERAFEAMKRMQKNPKKWVMTLPVLENNTVVGLLRMHDIIHSGI